MNLPTEDLPEDDPPLEYQETSGLENSVEPGPLNELELMAMELATLGTQMSRNTAREMRRLAMTATNEVRAHLNAIKANFAVSTINSKT